MRPCAISRRRHCDGAGDLYGGAGEASISAMPSTRRAFVVTGIMVAGLFALASLASGCRGGSPSEPVPQATEACCKVTSEDRQRSAGCRIAGRCRGSEPVWMRGAVSCGPVESERCMGGRCCRFLSRDEQVGPIYDWDADDGQEPPSRPGNETIEAPAPAEGGGPVSDGADDQVPPEGM